MRRIIASILMMATIFALVTISTIGKYPTYPVGFYYLPSYQMSTFSSNTELRNFLQISLSNPGLQTYVAFTQSGTGMSSERLENLKAIFGLDRNVGPWRASSDYSETNIQVEGVDEADIVKTDGEFIYLISGSCLTIVKAYPAKQARIVSEIHLNGIIRGTFINSDKLVLFEETSQPPRTSIKIYSIVDRGNPKLDREVSYDGYYFSSRMIDNYVYVVVNEVARIVNNEVVLPRRYYDNWIKEVSATEIHYCDILDYSYTFTTIISININNSQNPSEETILLGNARVMYVSLNNIYITYTENDRTLIYRIQIDQDQIRFAATGEVPGRLLNQFSMDEYKNYFRIATMHTYQRTQSSHVYVLDMTLQTIGRLQNLAPGERMHSARFMGNRCYLVTFKKVDPLFVIDLEYPSHPVVLGELKITGYSDYLHPFNETCIIGIGKETAGGNAAFSWYQGVKISLFDVSDVRNPLEIAKCEIGDRGTDSPVLKDHKALLFDKSRTLLAIPILVAEINNTNYPKDVPENTFGDFVWQGVYVFHISPEQGIILRGRITHLEENLHQLGRYSSNYVTRSLYINDVLYTLSDTMIKMNNLETLDEINRIDLTS